MNFSYSKNRNSGVSLIGDVPWGTQFCQFYDTEKELFDILTPYFRTGLENNELCLFVFSGSLDIRETEKVFAKDIPCYKKYLKDGRIKLILSSHWRDKTVISVLDEAILS